MPACAPAGGELAATFTLSPLSAARNGGASPANGAKDRGGQAEVGPEGARDGQRLPITGGDLRQGLLRNDRPQGKLRADVVQAALRRVDRQ